MQEIPTKYNPKDVEDKWYRFWQENRLFHAELNQKKISYSIVIPPPNITGILHMGHALNNTIQDILIRFKKMRGYESLWMPGTDHAGIATQNVVEKKLGERGVKRQDLGREKFLEEVWKWRNEYGSTIISQLKKLGCACDWDRIRFTMDKGLSNAVLEVFIRLYEKDLIYRGNYIINWCPRCQTALSDEEAQHKDVDGMLYYIKYPVKSSREHLVVATTRPETMLGDVAVCVNPKDKRYKFLKGKTAILPILNRELKVIFDSKVDPKFGTGVLKVTPAHDPIDFELGIKHGLTPLNVMDSSATMNEMAGDYKGMDRFEAREAIIDDLKERDLFVKSEPHKQAIGHCYRCHTMIEPRLSRQWFVRMGPLAKPAIDAVKKGKIKFYPKRWTKVYLNWMENIRDWCISRQIWWGHRIPVYYCKDCSRLMTNDKIQMTDKIQNPNDKKGVIVSKTKPEKCPDCGSTDIEQDPDVLDTWFSSWLWPFSTFGWPFDQKTEDSDQRESRGAEATRERQKTEEFKYFYPTDALVTAQEIIFFWVARMIMAGLEFIGDIPFRDVYIHGTVRDLTGTKMSKSLGNIIDPLDIIERFGTDALRFSIISITAQGQDVFLSDAKFQLGRNFANKLWNASRFVLLNLKKDKAQKDLCLFVKDKDLSLADSWILSRFYEMLGDVTRSLENYRFNEAANRIYEFLWHEYCDWYIEISKITIDDDRTQLILCKMLEKSLRVLHPIMPFITEEIWHSLPREADSIMAAPWPHIQKQFISKRADSDMRLIIDIVTAIRNIRSTWHIEQNKKINAILNTSGKKDLSLLKTNGIYIKHLAGVDGLEVSSGKKRPRHAATAIVRKVEVYIPLEGIIDFKKEKGKLNEKLAHLRGFLKSLDKKLKNKGFLSKAPKAIVEKELSKRDDIKQEIAKIRKNIKIYEPRPS